MVNPMLLEFEVYRSGIRHRWRLVVPTPPLSLQQSMPLSRVVPAEAAPDGLEAIGESVGETGDNAMDPGSVRVGISHRGGNGGLRRLIPHAMSASSR